MYNMYKIYTLKLRLVHSLYCKHLYNAYHNFVLYLYVIVQCSSLNIIKHGKCVLSPLTLFFLFCSSDALYQAVEIEHEIFKACKSANLYKAAVLKRVRV